MRYSARVQAIVNALAAKHPDLRHGDDDARRALTLKFAEQCCHELGLNWGTKRAAQDRPLSADVICTRDPFIGWDVQLAGGIIAQFPESIDLQGQVFVSVSPVDHLGNAQPPPPPQPCAPEVIQRLKDIETELVLLRVSVAKLHERPAPVVAFPNYTGRIFGYGVTWRPERNDG